MPTDQQITPEQQVEREYQTPNHGSGTCIHGRQERKCPHCELEYTEICLSSALQRIAELEAENAKLRTSDDKRGLTD